MAPPMKPMVGWYDPAQLLRTAQEVAVSTLFGRHADYRLVEAVASAKIDVDDYSQDNADFWVDYASDVGDGWNSTYAVAKAIAQPRLALWDSSRRCHHDTQRGSLLIFGGDAVYPTASRSEYADRLVSPYQTALPGTETPHPCLYAIPGNHDWYDSLVAFMRLFCNARRIGGWQTRQTRSYFALKLPRGWWLVGTDVQLDSDIDAPQVRFFQSLADRLGPTDRVILCNAEPHWIYAHIYGKRDDDYNESNLAFLEHKIFGGRVKVFLAGDLHHYRRHEAQNGVQKITAGGGGAFLHPTNGPDVSVIGSGEYTVRKAFPDASVSRALCWRNLLFPILNPRFGKLTAFLYVMTAWAVMLDLSQYDLSQFWEALAMAVNTVLRSPVAGLWVVTIFLGFWLFTDTHSYGYRIIGGALHGMAHLLAVFVIGWLAVSMTVASGLGETIQLITTALLIAIGGWVVGSLIMGLYLLISLNVFGRHSTDAFSSLGIQDWKSFLRLKIDTRGDLTIYPIGIRRVPRRWKTQSEGPSLMSSDDPKATPPELIEPPVVLKK